MAVVPRPPSPRRPHPLTPALEPLIHQAARRLRQPADGSRPCSVILSAASARSYNPKHTTRCHPERSRRSPVILRSAATKNLSSGFSLAGAPSLALCAKGGNLYRINAPIALTTPSFLSKATYAIAVVVFSAQPCIADLTTRHAGEDMEKNAMNACIADELKRIPRGAAGSTQNFFRAAYRMRRMHCLAQNPKQSPKEPFDEAVKLIRKHDPGFKPNLTDLGYFG
jgi:hypothetical protein